MTDAQQIHRYSGFFHFNDEASIPALVDWLRTHSLAYAASLEKMESDNATDRHVQWCVKMDRPWSDKWTKQFEKKGAMGKYLVPDKKPNAGCKHSKRWSKQDSVKEGYTWESSLFYVGKDVKDPEKLWVSDGIVKDDIIGKFRYTEAQKTEYKKSIKAKSFFAICCEAYEEAGKPKERRSIVEMLIRKHCFGKWQYTRLEQIVQMADTLLMKYHNDDVLADMMAQYDTLFSKVKGK